MKATSSFRLLWILAILSSFHIAAYSQQKSLKDVEATQELSGKVAALFQDNKIPDAFDLLEPYWPLPKNELEAMEEKTIQLMNMLQDRFGNQFGYTWVRDEKIADIAIRETWMVQFEVSAIRLMFTYYKNPSGWIVNAFEWDDQMSEEFR